MLRIAICDDNLPITTEIETMLNSVSRQDCVPMEIDIYFDGESLYKKMQDGNNYDLIYMDIEMDGLDGIQTARLIRARALPTLLIYVSAYDKYFNDAYKKLRSNCKFFTFSFHQKYTKLPITDITYFESRGRDIIIHGLNGDHRFLGKLNAVEKQLEQKEINFIRIHQSYLINPYYISSITLSSVELPGKCLNISPKFQEKVRSQYLKIMEDL